MHHRTHRSALLAALTVASALAGTACTDNQSAATSPELGRRAAAPAPSPLATINAFGPNLTLWPFTGSDFGQTAMDPVNLVFVGQADARALRAALLLLDGDRTAFGMPPVEPFNCTWHDSPDGDVQTAYTEPGGWMGSAIQLACGPYGPLRFHVRFFQAGAGPVLGGVHFELQIPGTTSHQVLSWEIAKQLVTVDLLRTGLLDPAAPLMPSPAIHPAPWRGIPSFIYNGLPPELIGLLMSTGSPAPPVADSAPIITDGSATVFNVAGSVDGQPGVFREAFTINFDQVIPKPFCAGGAYQYLYVQGPVNFREVVVLTRSGNLLSQFWASGRLSLTPVDPTTSPPTPLGETYRALVKEHHTSIVTDRFSRVSSRGVQVEIPATGPFRGRMVMHLAIGPHQASQGVDITCAP